MPWRWKTELSTLLTFYRGRKNGLYVVWWNSFLLFLDPSAWPCLGPSYIYVLQTIFSKDSRYIQIFRFFRALYVPDALSGFECAVCDDGVVADDGLARGQHLRRVVRVPHAIPERGDWIQINCFILLLLHKCVQCSRWKEVAFSRGSSINDVCTEGKGDSQKQQIALMGCDWVDVTVGWRNT